MLTDHIEDVANVSLLDYNFVMECTMRQMDLVRMSGGQSLTQDIHSNMETHRGLLLSSLGLVLLLLVCTGLVLFVTVNGTAAPTALMD